MSDLAASVAFEVVRADHGEVSEVYFVTPRAAGEVSSGVDNLESNATRDTRHATGISCNKECIGDAVSLVSLEPLVPVVPIAPVVPPLANVTHAS